MDTFQKEVNDIARDTRCWSLKNVNQKQRVYIRIGCTILSLFNRKGGHGFNGKHAKEGHLFRQKYIEFRHGHPSSVTINT